MAEERYKPINKWPPPTGITVLVEKMPDPKEVSEQLKRDAKMFPPRERRILERAAKDL